MNTSTRLARRILAVLAATLQAGALSLAATITIQREGEGFAVSWPGNHFLQSAPSIAGPWQTLPNALPPHKIDAPRQMEFFRSVAGIPLNVTKTGTGAGTVGSTPAGISCGTDCKEDFLPGATVSLRATPDAGSTFAGWTGDCAGTGECTVTLDRPRSVTAMFTPAAPVNPFVNGDFEQGPFVGWAQEPGQLIFPAADLGKATPYSGQYAAWVGFDRDNRRLARLGQRVTLPSTKPLFLNFAAALYSTELCDVPWYDTVTIYINGQVAYQDDRVCRTDFTGWGKFSIDVSAYAGQSTAFVFEIYSADALASVVLIDDVAIADKAWAE